MMKIAHKYVASKFLDYVKETEYRKKIIKDCVMDPDDEPQFISNKLEELNNLIKN